MSEVIKDTDKTMEFSLSVVKGKLEADLFLSDEIKEKYIPHFMEGMAAIFKQNPATEEDGDE